MTSKVATQQVLLFSQKISVLEENIFKIYNIYVVSSNSTALEQTSFPTKTHSVMRGVVWVDKDGLGLTVIVVLVVVLLGLPGNVGGGVSRVLTSGGDVVALEDPEDIKYVRDNF